MVLAASKVGIFHSTDTAGPKVGGVVWPSLTAVQRAAVNIAAFDVWSLDPQNDGGELRLDKKGRFEFPMDRVLVPGERILSGAGGAILQGVGAAGTFLVGPRNGTQAVVRSLALDGGGTDPLGLDALCDYLVDAPGGPGMLLEGVSGVGAKVAAIHCKGASMKIFGCDFDRWGEIGLWSEGCSECEFDGLALHGGPTGGPYPEIGVLLEGSNAGTNTRSGQVMANGGLWRMRNLIGSNALVGVQWNGVSGGSLLGGTFEGAQQTTYLTTNKSTGITGQALRSNAGNYAVIDDSVSIHLQGTCSAGQKVRYLNNSRGSKVDVHNESNASYVPIEHVFGADGNPQQWVAWRNAEGHWVSRDNNAPTEGYWELAQEVRRRVRTVGQPLFWTCGAVGNPNGGGGSWSAGPNAT